MGIGTTNPNGTLTVKNITDGAEILTLATAYANPSGRQALTWRDSTNITGQIDTSYNGGVMSMNFGHLYNSGYQTGDIMTLKGNGNVGVGTTSPLAKLDVWGNLNIATGSTPTLFANTATGNVGIGTSSPSAKLDIYDSTGYSKIGNLGIGGNYSGISLNGTYDVTNYNLLSDATLKHLYMNRPSGSDIVFREANDGSSQMIIKTGGNVGIGSTTPSSRLTVQGNAWFGGNITATGTLSISATSTLATTTATAIMIGTTTPFSLAKMFFDVTTNASGSTNAIAGIHSNFNFNPIGGGVQIGNRLVVNNIPTVTANTSVGDVIRTIDNTTLTNTVRGIEVVSNAGSNTYGINTGIRTTGATFGIQAFTSGLAGGVSAPAALYGEVTTPGASDILRLYSGTSTSGTNMAQFYQELSTFSGTGLLMDLGAGGGSFTGNFVDLQNNDVTKFIIDKDGKVGIGTSTLSTSILTVAGDIRVGTTGTNGCLKDFSGGTIAGTGCVSDENLKTNIVDINNILSKIVDLRVVNYNWNQLASNIYGNHMGPTQTGYLAQNVESVFPELVHINQEGYKEVNYTGLGLYAVEGVKELSIITNQASSSIFALTNGLDNASTSILALVNLVNSNYTESSSTFASIVNTINASTTNIQSEISNILNVINLNNAKENSVSINSLGYIGINTSHPLKLLHISDATATGSIARFENSNGYCDIDPSTKALVCTTDDSLRTNEYLIDSTSTIATSTDITANTSSTTLEKLTQLHVVTYSLPSETTGSSTHTGLILSDIEILFPNLVTVDISGNKTLSYTNLIPYIIESIKSLAVQVAEFRNMITTRELLTETVCVGTKDNKTCLTKNQIDQILLLQSSQSVSASNGSNTNGTSTTSTNGTSTSSTASTTPDTIPPEISIIGNNPETINLNDIYTDQGATAFDLIDSTTTVLTTGTVDTTTAGTYTITYSSSDLSGNTATSTRVVNVQ